MKLNASASEMSNLVGMYGFLIQESKVKARIFINGKADNTYFICQVISPLTGEPNVAKLMTLEDLKNWVLIPTQELANLIYDDYLKNGCRYSLPF